MNNEEKKLMRGCKKLGDLFKNLSDTEAKAYLYIKEAKQPLAIREMPHNLQGTIGHLKKYDLVEIYRTPTKVYKHGFPSIKMTNCVRIKEVKELSKKEKKEKFGF